MTTATASIRPCRVRAGYDPYPVGDKFSRFKTSPASLQMTPVTSRLWTNPFGTPWMDLANYAIMTILEMVEGKG